LSRRRAITMLLYRSCASSASMPIHLPASVNLPARSIG
jgi:hypothetical protein